MCTLHTIHTSLLCGCLTICYDTLSTPSSSVYLRQRQQQTKQSNFLRSVMSVKRGPGSSLTDKRLVPLVLSGLNHVPCLHWVCVLLSDWTKGRIRKNRCAWVVVMVVLIVLVKKEQRFVFLQLKTKHPCPATVTTCRLEWQNTDRIDCNSGQSSAQQWESERGERIVNIFLFQNVAHCWASAH